MDPQQESFHVYLLLVLKSASRASAFTFEIGDGVCVCVFVSRCCTSQFACIRRLDSSGDVPTAGKTRRTRTIRTARELEVDFISCNFPETRQGSERRSSRVVLQDTIRLHVRLLATCFVVRHLRYSVRQAAQLAVESATTEARCAIPNGVGVVKVRNEGRMG